MISLKKQKGFTLVELLIVIIIIGILATLVIVTFTGVQAKARDSQRQTDIEALDSHVEAFFAEKGYYPSYADLTDSSWVSTNLKGLDPASLVDPKGGSIQAGASDASHYGYTVSTGGATPASCETDDTTCQAFTLEATMESDGSTFSKASN